MVSARCCDFADSYQVTGRSFAIVPYSEAKEGFIDLDEDDSKDEDSYLSRFQRSVVNLRGDEWN